MGRVKLHVVRCATKELGIAPPVERSGGILLPCAVRIKYKDQAAGKEVRFVVQSPASSFAVVIGALKFTAEGADSLTVSFHCAESSLGKQCSQ